jgi:hypothetical protein
MMHIASTLIRRLAPVLAPAFVLAALGCHDDANSPDVNSPDDANSPTEPTLGTTGATQPAHETDVRLITAGGTFTQPFPDPVGSEVTFSVDAIRHPDGSFDGRFLYVTRIHRPSPLPVNQIRTTGVVDCFVVEGNLVIIGGRIIRSNFDDIGQPIVINLTDRSDAPDLASGLTGPPGSFEACAQQTRSDQFPVDGVNLHSSLR